MEVTQTIDLLELVEKTNTALGFGICSFIAVLILIGVFLIYGIEKNSHH